MYIFTMLAIIIGVTVLLTQNSVESKEMGWENKPKNKFVFGGYKKAAVTSSGSQCSSVGKDMLLMNGSAVDAAIATLLCEGVVSLEDNGLGGGFLMTIWDPSNGGTATVLDATETAPAAAIENMFHGRAALSQFGGKAVAVPGALKGYWEAHKKYGKLPWSTLFEPSIKLCNNGMVVYNKDFASFLASKESTIHAEPTIAEFLVNPKTNRTWKVNDIIKRPKLANTLKLLSKKKGIRSFYGGRIGKELIKEIEAFGGIMTINDLKNYTPLWRTPMTSKIGGYTMYTSPPPGSGVFLSFIMNVLNGVISVESEKVAWQRFVETLKWTYARRTELGDPAYVDIKELVANLTSVTYANDIRQLINDYLIGNDPKYYGVSSESFENHKIAHICVVAPDGSMVTVSSSINRGLGAMRRSKSTGIIFNHQMYDFGVLNVMNGSSSPPSSANFIAPGKRSQNSMAPTIIMDENNQLLLAVGAAGGADTLTPITMKIILILSATGTSFDESLIKLIRPYLRTIGYKVTANAVMITKEYELYAETDLLGDGTIAGF